MASPSGTGAGGICVKHGVYEGRVCPKCAAPSGTGHDTAGWVCPNKDGFAPYLGNNHAVACPKCGAKMVRRVTEAAPAHPFPNCPGRDIDDCAPCVAAGFCVVDDDPPVAVPGPASVSPAEPPGFRAELDVLLNAFADVPEVVRVLKVTEEAGEAAQAYIGVTGLNPRKCVTHSNDELADELADVALTALVALGAFTADPIQRLTNRVAYVADRHRREVLDRGR